MLLQATWNAVKKAMHSYNTDLVFQLFTTFDNPEQ